MQKERAPARTTPYTRFHCNDCGANFRARYLANRNTKSTQHYCAVYAKVVTRKVGVHSQKCEASHSGPCLRERDGPSRDGYESEDEAKSNQKRDKKNGVKPKPPKPSNNKKQNNVRLGGSSNKNKSKNKNKNKDNTNVINNNASDSDNGTNTYNRNRNNSSDSDNETSGFLMSDPKTTEMFGEYLYRSKKSKKRFQREENAEQESWLPTHDKKRRRKNKTKNRSNGNSNSNSKSTSNDITTSSAAGNTIALPIASDEEDFDISPSSPRNNNKNNKNNTNNTNGDKFSSFYGKPINKSQRPLVRVLKDKSPIEPKQSEIPAVLPLNGNNNNKENNSDIDENSNTNTNTNGKKINRNNIIISGNVDNTNDDSSGSDYGPENGHRTRDRKNGNDNTTAAAAGSDIFQDFVKIYTSATECMKNQNFEGAIDTLDEALNDSTYQNALKLHPIFSESFLILAHAYQALDSAEDALECLANILYFDNLPLPLQMRIKDTEVQLLEYTQKFEEAEKAKVALTSLRQRTNTAPYDH